MLKKKVTILHGEINTYNGSFFMSKLAQRLIGVFFIFLMLFTFPIINVFWKSEMVLGMPLIYLYIFGAWLLLIFIMIWIVEKEK